MTRSVRLRRLALAVLVGIATAAWLRLGREFPLALAAIAGLAVGMLAAMALRTVAQLRELWRTHRDGWVRDDGPTDGSGGS